VEQAKIIQRKSNFELLRIFSMFLICTHHFVIHGVYNFASQNILTPFNNVFSAILSTPGKLGVALFLLITGYFMVDAMPKIKHAFSLYFQTWFYSIIFLGLYLCNVQNIQPEIIKCSLFPVVHNAYWFITGYLILYILIPFINKVFKFIFERHYEYYAFIGFTVLFLIIHTEISDFAYLYCLGGFIKKEIFPFNKLKIKHYASGIILLFVWLTYYAFTNIWSANPADFGNIMHIAGTLHSPYILLSAICIFCMFSHLDFGVNNFINNISKNVLGVYLIHENIIVRPILWQHVFQFLNNINYIIYPVISLIVIFILFGLFILADKIFSKFYRIIPEIIFKSNAN